MRQLCLLVVVCVGLVGAAELSPDYGAIAFRYDDNQTVEIWNKICAVFEKYQAPLCASWITDRIVDDQSFRELGAKMVAAGHEIMDHTPVHNPFVVSITHEDQLGDAKVHHKDEKSICLDYTFGKQYLGESFTVQVKTNAFDIPESLAKRNYILVEEKASGKLYWLRTNPKLPGKLVMLDFWAHGGLDFGERELTLQCVNPRAVDVAPENIRFLVRCSKRNFEAMGLPVPQCWIQPGGPMLALMAEQLQAALEAENYVSAATYGAGPKFTCNPSWQLERYRMQWGDIHPERETVAKMKTLIADGLAKRRVFISGSHLRGNNYPGGWPKFLEAHDELLAWLKENHIPVVTQAVLAKAFYSSCLQISGNLLPDLDRDIDGNGRPDGWEPAKGTSIQDGTIQFQQDGVVFSINNLGGATPGEWTLTCKHDLPKGATLQLQIIPLAVRNPSGKSITISMNQDNPVDFTLPPKTQQVILNCKANNLQGHTVTLKNIQILRKK